MTFERVLKRFGFKRIRGLKGCYQKDQWYAEIYNHGGWKNVWMVGGGLKNSHLFPGGWFYHEPQQVVNELNRATKSRN